MTDKKKQFFPSSGCINTAIWMHHIDAKCMEKKLDNNYTRMLRAVFKQVLEATPHKTAAVQSPNTHHENYLS